MLVGPEVLLNNVLCPCKSGTRSDEHGSVRVEARFLGNIGNAQILLQLQGAVIGFVDARQNLEQRRLARAIAANQADTFIAFK